MSFLNPYAGQLEPAPAPTPAPAPAPSTGLPGFGPYQLEKPAATATPTTGTAKTAAVAPPDKNAAVLLQQMLEDWGLGTLAPQVVKFLQQGYDSTAIGYLLQQTPEYQKRFAANAQRVKNGLPALSPGEYIATERSYQDVLRSAGLPSGFYDSPDDFTQWLSKDVSPAEIKDRADQAVKFSQATDPTYKQALQTYYGVDAGHVAAYFLDPTRALPLIEKQANAANIGAAALSQGLQLTNLQDAYRYTDQGVTEQQARGAYSNIADILPNESAIAQRFGQQYTQTDAEQELLGGLASAQRKRQQLNQSEQGLFAGSGGVGSNFYHEAFGLASDTANF